MQVSESKSIFVIIDFHPFGLVTKDGKNEGLFGRFSSFIKNRTGIPFNDILLPIPRQSWGLIKGSIDFTITGLSTKAIKNTI